MAKFIERPEEDENEEFASLPTEEETTELEEPTVEEAPEVAPEDDIPDKYRGKDLKDIVRMHQEAEKLLGRQSSEVGELRRTVDDFIKTQLSQQQESPQAQGEDELDIFVDPERYVAKAIEKHPKIQEAERLNRQAKQSSVKARLNEAHPDMETIVGDAGFQDWVKASKVRTELFLRADQQYDFDSADELLSSWKERRNIVKQTEAVNKQDRKSQAKAAATGSAKASAEPASRKVYRRADIIHLMRNDPKRYASLSDEIMKAYAEGRVK